MKKKELKPEKKFSIMVMAFFIGMWFNAPTLLEANYIPPEEHKLGDTTAFIYNMVLFTYLWFPYLLGGWLIIKMLEFKLNFKGLRRGIAVSRKTANP